jgi:hypothetical protein
MVDPDEFTILKQDNAKLRAENVALLVPSVSMGLLMPTAWAPLCCLQNDPYRAAAPSRNSARYRCIISSFRLKIGLSNSSNSRVDRTRKMRALIHTVE